MKFSKVKKYISRFDLNGLYIQLIGSNKQIADKLLETINAIQKQRKWCLDYSMFERVYKNIDYLNLKNTGGESL